MIYYVLDNQRYLDIYLLWLITKQNRSFLYRMLIKNKITQKKYKNLILYNFEDIGKCPDLVKLLRK